MGRVRNLILRVPVQTGFRIRGVFIKWSFKGWFVNFMHGHQITLISQKMFYKRYVLILMVLVINAPSPIPAQTHQCLDFAEAAIPGD